MVHTKTRFTRLLNEKNQLDKSIVDTRISGCVPACYVAKQTNSLILDINNQAGEILNNFIINRKLGCHVYSNI